MVIFCLNWSDSRFTPQTN